MPTATATSKSPELCHCGEPLHYLSKESERAVRALIDSLGPELPVHCGSRCWMVSRHYIALHGLRASDLPKLGFKEICGTCRESLDRCTCLIGGLR